MDRRFLTWLMLTTALCFLYLSMRPQVPEEKPDAKRQAAQQQDPLQLDQPAPADDGEPVADSPEADTPEKGVGEIGAEADAPTKAARPENPSQTILLGSMDPSKNFNLLVALNSRGAALERAELVGQSSPGEFRFRALEHDGGYLGYLGLTEELTGLQIHTIPEGSAAAAATSPDATGGLQIGDVISELNGQSTSSLREWQLALKETRPHEQAQLVVSRMVAGAPKKLSYTASLSQAPLDIIRVHERAPEAVPGNLARASLITTIASLNEARIPAGRSAFPALQEASQLNWASEPLEVPGGQGVTFRLPLESLLASTGRPGKLEIVKHYRLLPASEANDGFTLDLETIIENHNDEAVKASFRQEGLAGLTLEGWWYSVKISPHMFSGAGQRDVIYNTPFASHDIRTTRQINDHAKKTPAQPDMILFSENEPAEARSLKYIGLDAQYFNASLIPHPDAPDSLSNLRQAGASAVANVEDIVKSQAQATNVSFWIDSAESAIAAEGQISQRYQVFLGPKDTQVLADHGLDRAIEYGWFPWIAKPLSAILHFFYAIVRNYGLAIVMLTVMVRGLMFPLGRKAAMNAQRMQELQPELKRINELYKDNMEKRAKAMQELYAKHNFKPLAGCLPMFIQLPIFIGLYRCLSVDISLRQQPLIPGIEWCSNLAAPDQLLDWSSWMPAFFAERGVGWLGPYFNILPMVTVLLFIVQQKMLMPKATDDQTRMTQNMMQVMTIFMGVLFFKVPSGLCIYFITSSLWSLVERKLVKRMTPPTSPALLAAGTDGKGPDGKSPSKPSGNPKGSPGSRKRRGESEAAPPSKTASKMQELAKMLEKPAVKSATQRGSRKNRKRN
ncbi:YidC/Oxa1 family insertase periplasmic-domain containing protein [Aureliella helgolandensis]|uniref:Membrane protein insertase YidC n=1 Tax=Aureliella helgolandensis TaxID=2527968 RepID=A0A518GEQ5_9BACT|nr:YidC/Oxa1 family insertase periplasmic-domain containing protein [Aureliella helgolandensis]QDV27073.1 Membrane protein insertase YidC [Aureliella helgolandensis]